MKNLLPAAATALLFIACATPPFHKVDGELRAGNYAAAAETLEAEKPNLYGKGAAILYNLDKGMLSHYAGRYEDSTALLQDGERAIEAAYTKSVTQEIGSYLVNDTLKDYEGEDYEDIYLNAFNALNYYHLGKLDDALVEVRRMNNKIRFLGQKYGKEMDALQKQALDSGTEIPPAANSGSTFTDSALARYLGMIFYRAEGSPDDARIDYDGLRLVFADNKNLYPFPPPSSAAEELETKRGPDGNLARLNLIAFSGLSPVKRQETVRIPLIGLVNYIKIALPVMDKRPSQVAAVELQFDDGSIRRFELLESMEDVAADTFRQKSQVIYMKTIIRAISKGATSTALDAAAHETDDGMVSLALSLLSLGNKVFAEASEQADLRLSHFFPGRAWVCGVNLEPGTYSFRVNFLNRSGHVLESMRAEHVTIQNGKLNLMEAVCLQ